MLRELACEAQSKSRELGELHACTNVYEKLVYGVPARVYEAAYTYSNPVRYTGGGTAVWPGPRDSRRGQEGSRSIETSRTLSP